MILGKHTLAETRDLLAVVDYRVKETQRQFDALPLPGKTAELQADWDAVKAHWTTLRQEIADELHHIALMTPLTSANLVATESTWQKLLAFTQGQELVKGSFQDVVRRIGIAKGSPVDFPNDPKQNSPDVDLGLFKEVDGDIRTMEAASRAAKSAAKEVVTSNTGLIIGGTILGTLATVAVVKFYLR